MCSPPVRIDVQPSGPPYCAARPNVQPSGPLCCAARPDVQPSGPPCAARRLVQPFGALCCAARPLVQPFGSLCCAGRPLVQLAGPPKIHIFQLGTRPSSPPGPPALRLVSSARYVRNVGGMVPLPPWLRLWLEEKNEKETVLS